MEPRKAIAATSLAFLVGAGLAIPTVGAATDGGATPPAISQVENYVYSGKNLSIKTGSEAKTYTITFKGSFAGTPAVTKTAGDGSITDMGRTADGWAFTLKVDPKSSMTYEYALQLQPGENVTAYLTDGDSQVWAGKTLSRPAEPVKPATPQPPTSGETIGGTVTIPEGTGETPKDTVTPFTFTANLVGSKNAMTVNTVTFSGVETITGEPTAPEGVVVEKVKEGEYSIAVPKGMTSAKVVFTGTTPSPDIKPQATIGAVSANPPAENAAIPYTYTVSLGRLPGSEAVYDIVLSGLDTPTPKTPEGVTLTETAPGTYRATLAPGTGALNIVFTGTVPTQETQVNAAITPVEAPSTDDTPKQDAPEQTEQTIPVRVWDDTSKDGVRDDGEAFVSGVTMTSASTGKVVTLTQQAQWTASFTGQTGEFSYTVSIPHGYTLLTGFKDTDKAVYPNAQGVVNVTLKQGQEAPEVRIPLVARETGTITVNTWIDNGDGIKREGERAPQALRVELLSDTGAILAQRTTDSTGKATFVTTPGDYRVRVMGSDGTRYIVVPSGVATDPSGTSEVFTVSPPSRTDDGRLVSASVNINVPMVLSSASQDWQIDVPGESFKNSGLEYFEPKEPAKPDVPTEEAEPSPPSEPSETPAPEDQAPAPGEVTDEEIENIKEETPAPEKTGKAEQPREGASPSKVVASQPAPTTKTVWKTINAPIETSGKSLAHTGASVGFAGLLASALTALGIGLKARSKRD